MATVVDQRRPAIATTNAGGDFVLYGDQEPQDVFDPVHFEAVRRPLEAAETLPAWAYTSPKFYARERDRIFLKNWNCIGHNTRVPNVGSYITFDFMGIPLIVVRAEDFTVRAFINSCSHRGAELLSGEGECKFLKCAYHAWTYSLEGELVGTPLFEESGAFKKSQHSLRSVRLEEWAGCMWINFDPHGPDLRSYLGDLPDRVLAWTEKEMVCVARVTYPMAGNWKLHVENFNDAGHVPFVHKSSLNWKSVARRELHDPSIYIGNYIMHYTLFEGTRGVEEGHKALPEIDLPPNLKRGTFFPYVYPNTGLGFNIDSYFVSELYPEGPNHCTYIRSFIVEKSALDLPDSDLIIQDYLGNLDRVTREDLEVIENMQRSMTSPLYRPGRFATLDKLVHDCDNWVLDRVIGTNAS